MKRADSAHGPPPTSLPRTREQRRSFYEHMARRAVSYPPLIPPSSGRSRERKVSVIVRTVDRPALLREALSSLANQTFYDFEVVLVCDGGSGVDGIAADFEPYLQLRTVRLSPAGGRSAALNAGLDAAHAKWITYLDDDDIVYPTHLELLTTALHQAPQQVAYSLVHKVLRDDTAGRTLARQPFQILSFDPDQLLIENYIPLHSLMHARACIESVGSFDGSFDVLEDWEFVIRLSRRYAFRAVMRFTGDYRFRVAAQSMNAITSQPFERLEATRRVYDMYPAHNRAVRSARRANERALRRLIDELRRIRELPLSDEEKALFVTSVVGGIEPNRDSVAAPSFVGPGGAVLKVRLVRRAMRWLAHRNARFRRFARRLQARALEEQALKLELSPNPDRSQVPLLP